MGAEFLSLLANTSLEPQDQENLNHRYFLILFSIRDQFLLYYTVQ